MLRTAQDLKSTDGDWKVFKLKGLEKSATCRLH